VLDVHRNGNRIALSGVLRIEDLYKPLAVLHHAVQAGYQDIVLDFSKCTAAFAGPMLGLCCRALKLRGEQIEVAVVPPENSDLARHFRNTNWAHLLDPENNPPSAFKGFTLVPATQFRNVEEQQQAVNRIVNAILGAIPTLERKEFAALEWSVNEITDNVLVHSRSPFGGLVQVSTFHKASKRVEYIVADGGVGIPVTLRQADASLSDAAALELAIREGVTRDKAVGQGNGLFGSYQICSRSLGFFQLESGHGKLAFTVREGLHVNTESVPFDGTLVAAQIDFSNPLLLSEALSFGGKPHEPTDFVETHYEQPQGNDVLFLVKDEATSFGSRVAGTPVRNKLFNLAHMCSGRIAIDFSDVPLVSSSFADEALGKLFAELGPVGFVQKFELRNVAPTVQQLLDKAIAQRMATGKK
jgi:hypothetical protein